MAESMKGLHRTCRCAEVTKEMTGSRATLMGWVQKARNKGGLVFVDLRDRSGIMQVIFENGSIDEEGFEKAGKLRSEFVIAVTGIVEKRGGAVNENLATGELELRANELRVLSESEVPPFPIEENSKTKDEIRLKYRYLDLRRPDIQRNLMMKSQVATHQKILCRRRFSGGGDSDPWKEYTGRRQRLPGSVQSSSGQLLRTAAVSAALQAASYVFRI